MPSTPPMLAGIEDFSPIRRRARAAIIVYGEGKNCRLAPIFPR